MVSIWYLFWQKVYISKSSKLKICTQNIFPRVILERFRMSYFKKNFNHGEAWFLEKPWIPWNLGNVLKVLENENGGWVVHFVFGPILVPIFLFGTYFFNFRKKLVSIWYLFLKKVVPIWSLIGTFFWRDSTCHHWV